LAAFGEVERAGAAMRGMEKPSLRNDAVFLPFLLTETRSEASKPPRFTKSGQEPNGIKLSPKQSQIREVIEL
jgi:hypothetical protein